MIRRTIRTETTRRTVTDESTERREDLIEIRTDSPGFGAVIDICSDSPTPRGPGWVGTGALDAEGQPIGEGAWMRRLSLEEAAPSRAADVRPHFVIIERGGRFVEQRPCRNFRAAMKVFARLLNAPITVPGMRFAIVPL